MSITTVIPPNMYRNTRKRSIPVQSPRRHAMKILLVLVSSALIVNPFAGDRGFIDVFEARRQSEWLDYEVNRLRGENDRLRALSVRLQTDVSAIEEVARRDLGLAKQGELVFVVTDTPRTRRATHSSECPSLLCSNHQLFPFVL